MALSAKLPSRPSLHLISFFRLILLLVVFHKTKALVKLPPNVSIPALFTYGDSIMDTGNNNNNHITDARCNFPPYGKDFGGGIPTGRFSNGKVPSDLLVEELGIKELLPAYLDPNLQPIHLPTGVNFASGGAGYDPLTSNDRSVIPLSGQLDLFKEYKWKLKRLVGLDRLNFIVANSVSIVASSSNDIATTNFGSRERQKQYDFPTYSDFLVSTASDFLEELYQLGARRIGVFSAPPAGCVPIMRTIKVGIARNCVEEINDAVQLFNSKLSKELDSLNKNLSDSRIVYIDVYNPLLDIIVNYQKYGFKVGDRGCCGTGLIEVTFTCRGRPMRLNHSDYVFWDSIHPTEVDYRMLVVPYLQNYVNQLI